MGYHKAKIKKGHYGSFSKIQEEYQELQDARDQDDSILELVELSDLVGAIDGYMKSKYLMTIEDVIKFAKKTQSSFEKGERI